MRRRLALAAVLLLAALALWWAWPRQQGPVATSAPGLAATAPSPWAAPPGQAPPPPGLPIRVVAPLAPPDAQPATFEGRVVSAATRAPIAGADLSFSRGGAAATVRTGRDGSFAFAPPTEGRWLLATVSARGFFPFAPEWGHSPVQLEARAGQHVRGLEIHLAPATELTGEVVDEEGHPVPGAAVRLLGTADEAALLTVADRFTAGPDGRFAFAAPPGSVLEATHPGFLPGRAEVGTLERVARRVVITLGARHQPLGEGGPIGGVVVITGGAPLEGALVSATREGSGGGGWLVAQALSGADGAFTLRDVPAGKYRVTARAEGRAPASARPVEPGERGLRLELSTGGRLRGCVRDAASGAPVAPFTVLVFARQGPLRRVAQRSLSVVAPGGCYALDDLAPGPIAVIFSAPGYAPSEEARVELPAPQGEAPGAEEVVDGRLEPGGRVFGRVVDATTGAPLAGALLSVEGLLTSAASTFPVLAEAETDLDGRFTLTGLPRRSSVHVAAAGHHARILGGVEAEPGAARGPLEVALHAVEPGETPRTELAGLGLQLATDGPALVVTGVLAGGGAAEVGLARGDQILAVEGRRVDELGFSGTVDAIRGPEGTVVRLTVQRDGVVRELVVPRRLVSG